MSDPLEVTPGERGVVRIFTTDLEPEGDAAITPKNVGRLLGDGVVLNHEKVEVFPSRMVEGMGLASYLQEGHGVAEEELGGKAAVLNALSGLVIVIPSSAFPAEGASLEPNAALRFIGAFREEKPSAPVRMASHPSAEGGVPPVGPSPSERRSRQVQKSWIIALGALILAAALVLFIAF